jgi:hypothetical protein
MNSWAGRNHHRISWCCPHRHMPDRIRHGLYHGRLTPQLKHHRVGQNFAIAPVSQSRLFFYFDDGAQGFGGGKIHTAAHFPARRRNLIYFEQRIRGPMTIRRRLTIVAAVLVFTSILYGAGRHYSSSLIQYVVEQSLIQKAPAGTDPVDLEKRLEALVSGAPDQNAKMRILLRTSEYLEKVQSLTREDLDKLLAPGGQ